MLSKEKYIVKTLKFKDFIQELSWKKLEQKSEKVRRVVHKLRHTIIKTFWHPLAPASRFFVLRLSYFRHKNLNHLEALTSFMDDP